MKKTESISPLSAGETSSQRKLLSIYIWGYIALAFICGIVTELCVWFAYDSQLNYFSDSPVVFSLYGSIAIAVLFAASSIFTLKRSNEAGYIYNVEILQKACPSSILPAIGAIVCAAARIYDKMIRVGLLLDKFDMILIALCFIAAAYFICAGFFINTKKEIKIALCIPAMLAFGISAIEAYFEYELEMNSPVKLFMQFAAVFCMAYLASEAKYIIGTQRPRRHLIFTSIASALSLVSAVLYITLYINGRVNNVFYLAINIWLITMLIYMSERAFKMTKRREQAVDEISESADSKEGI